MKDAAGFIDSLRRSPPGGVYIFYGEEPQLIDEARAALRAAGNFGKNIERASLELFGDSSAPDSQIASSPGDALFGGGAYLYEITAHAPPTGIHAVKTGGGTFQALQKTAARVSAPDSLSVSFYGLEYKHFKAKWFSDLCAGAVAVSCPRLDAAQTAKWCKKWAREWNLPVSEGGVLRLAEQTAGNLSAAKQCLQKMNILGEEAGESQAAAALSGGARYNIFQFVDAALAGEGKKTLAILNVLLEIEEPPPLLVWAVSSAVSGILAAKRGDYPAGLSRAAAAEAKAVKAGEGEVLEVLRRAARADRIAKGVETGDFGLAIIDAAAGLACLRRGNKIPTPKHPEEELRE